jgi:hypothetical protein
MIGYQDRINPTVFYFKEVRAKRFHPSTFDIEYSIFCGSLFNSGSSIEAADMIAMETSTYEVSYERRRWPEKRPV